LDILFTIFLLIFKASKETQPKAGLLLEKKQACLWFLKKQACLWLGFF